MTGEHAHQQHGMQFTCALQRLLYSSLLRHQQLRFWSTGRPPPPPPPTPPPPQLGQTPCNPRHIASNMSCKQICSFCITAAAAAPTCQPARKRSCLAASQPVLPVVHASTGGVGAAQLCHAQGDAQHAEANTQPAPNADRRTTIRQASAKRGCSCSGYCVGSRQKRRRQFMASCVRGLLSSICRAQSNRLGSCRDSGQGNVTVCVKFQSA
jgi:hypothetical protein